MCINHLSFLESLPARLLIIVFWQEKRSFISVIFQGLFGKGEFLSSFCYLIDKKEDRFEKNIDGKDCRFKNYAYFCDEINERFSKVLGLGYFSRAYIYN